MFEFTHMSLLRMLTAMLIRPNEAPLDAASHFGDGMTFSFYKRYREHTVRSLHR